MTPALRDRLRRAETVLSEILRSRTARIVGSFVALAALLALGSRLLEDPDSTRQAVTEVGLSGVAVAVLGLIGFHVTAIRSLAALGMTRAPQIWSQAQLLKYLPVPASALAGFLGSAVQHGHRARAALRGLVLHTLVLIIGATIAASGVLVSHASRIGPTSVMVVVTGVALVLAVATTLLIVRSGVPVSALLLALAAWTFVGLGFGLGLGESPAQWLDIGSAYAAAWVVGQLAVPVPAGLGVREAAFVFLLAPTMGDSQALVAALLSRVLHALSDGGVALIVGGFGRRRASSVEPDG